MFTGLVEDIGRVAALSPLASGKGLRLTLTAPLLREALPTGASLAVDGVCLTLVEQDAGAGRAAVEIGPETLERTTLSALRPGVEVNLERALRLSDRLGGHLVAGHVDAVGHISAVSARGEAWDLSVATPGALLRYIVEKGSIAIDGISLTVNRVDEQGFSVSLIPHSQARTTLSRKGPGGAVNLEVDLIGKYVEKLLGLSPAARSSGGLTLAQLKEHGFANKD